jgi:TolB-like protein/DNA-binding winged helix-turn-helix (wHTH) protein/cytochrome c-type biogenesis protein CcmH/NrfG
MATEGPSNVAVGDLLVDLDRAQVTRAGVEIPLPRLSYDLLIVLVDASPRVVSIDELMERVWPGLVVSPETVSQRIKLLRRALDDDADAPRYVAGVRGRGYRLLPAVERDRKPAHETAAAISVPAGAPEANDPSDVIAAEQRRPNPALLRHRLATVVVLGLLLAVAVGVARWNRPDTQTSVPSPDTAKLPDQRPSIAVLPFANRSQRTEDAFFVDGIHDDIVTQLTRVSGIRVIAPLSVERFRGIELPVKSIAEQLRVTTILQGSVQRDSHRVRISLQLMDAATETQIWANHFDRELTAGNVFAIQSEVAIAVAAALRTTLPAVEKARITAVPTRVLAAWEAYQLGNQRIARRNSTSLGEAEQFMRQAIELDPGFALAYAGLAQALTFKATYGGAPLDATLAKAEQAVIRALALDSNLAEAWGIAGLIASKRGRYDDAETMLRRAIALNPNFAQAYLWLGFPHARIEAEGLTLVQRAVALDPLSPIANLFYAAALHGAGRFAEATERLQALVERDPQFAPAYVLQAAQAAYAADRFDLALSMLARASQLDPQNMVAVIARTRMLMDLGEEFREHDPTDLAERLSVAESADAAAEDASLWLLYRGQRQESLRYARMALATNPRSRLALALLANADVAQGDVQAAVARYEAAHRIATGSLFDRVDTTSYGATIDLASLLLRAGETDRAKVLLDRSESVMRGMTRLGIFGFGIADVQILALRGEHSVALARLREAERAGWRGPLWRYYRDFDASLASIRNTPEFRAVFADIERDMARQRATLAAHPTVAAVDLRVDF